MLAYGGFVAFKLSRIDLQLRDLDVLRLLREGGSTDGGRQNRCAQKYLLHLHLSLQDWSRRYAIRFSCFGLRLLSASGFGISAKYRFPPQTPAFDLVQAPFAARHICDKVDPSPQLSEADCAQPGPGRRRSWFSVRCEAAIDRQPDANDETRG